MSISVGPKPIALNSGPTGNNSPQDLRKAAEGFETIFLQTYMKSARASSLGEDILGSNAVKSAQDMLDTELTQLAAARSNLGIADAVERQFRPLFGYKD